MFPLPLSAWIGIAGLVAVLGIGGYATIQSSRLDACKTSAAAFEAQVTAQGELARKAAEKADLEHQKAKETADAKITKLSANNAALVKRLRDNNPHSSPLPKPPADTSRPDLFCVDRAEYQREDGILVARLFERARGLADEGTANTMRLSTAAEWAASLAK